jgi:hypothetical protein
MTTKLLHQPQCNAKHQQQTLVSTTFSLKTIGFSSVTILFFCFLQNIFFVSCTSLDPKVNNKYYLSVATEKKLVFNLNDQQIQVRAICDVAAFTFT